MVHDNIISEIQAMIKYVLLELNSKNNLNNIIVIYWAAVTISQFEQNS